MRPLITGSGPERRDLDVLDRVLAASPLQAAARGRGRRRLCVLAYHGVDDAALFEAQMRWLRANANPVSLDEVERALLTGDALPPHSVLVTFDDGMRSVLEVGAPILRGLGIPAVAYVVVGLLDSEEPYWWVEAEQLVAAGAHVTEAPVPQQDAQALVRWLKTVPDTRRRAVLQELRPQLATTVSQSQLRRHELVLLERAGIRVESHSWSHPCLDRCADDQVLDEVLRAHAVLSDALGRSVRSFAYPNGNWDPRVRAAVAAAGCTTAFTFDHRTSPWPPPDPLAISRVRVRSDTALARFRCLVSGLHPALHHLRGRP